MDFGLTFLQRAMADKCRQFAEKEIAPLRETLQQNLQNRQHLFRQMAQNGLFLLALPTRYGGSLVGTAGYLAGLKSIAKVDAGIAVAMAVTNMVAEAIATFGTEMQRNAYLPKIADGSCVPLSFALTEESAGSDVKAMQTTFSDDPDAPGFLRLNGEKRFITNGDICGAMIVMARGRWENAQEGISAFLIDQGISGLSVVKREEKLGLLTANLVSLRFDQCRIAKTQLLGKGGEGLKIALGSLDNGRLGIAAQSLGIAEAAFEASLAFAKQRTQFGQAIFMNQAISFKLADMKVKLDAGQLLMYQAAWKKEQGLPYALESAEAKLFCSESCQQIALDAMQIFGGRGYTKDYPAERYLRDACVTTLYEGTSEIQRLVIARLLP